MKPGIERRMTEQIEKTKVYNTLFDVVVEASEVSLKTPSTNPGDNQYVITTAEFTSTIICNDNEWNTISVYIDIPELGDQGRIANLQINAHGNIEETYHNVPRSIRKSVMDYVDDVFEAIEGMINANTKEDTINE